MSLVGKKVNSYKDMDGNKVIKGDLVEVLGFNKPTKMKKVEAISKRGYMVFVRFENENPNGWILAKQHTRKINL